MDGGGAGGDGAGGGFERGGVALVSWASSRLFRIPVYHLVIPPSCWPMRPWGIVGGLLLAGFSFN